MRFSIVILLLIFLCIGCKEKKKYHDLVKKEIGANQPDVVQSILRFQEKLNAEFRNPETSPLSDRYRKDFENLDFFKPDTNYIVNARFVHTPNALPFLMPSTTNRKSEEVVYGIAYFELKGKSFQLEVYQNSELKVQEKYMDYLFLPFTDATNGVETYGGGRYIDLKIPAGDTIIIDFNKAYNPYCAYNKKFSCPIVPAVNAIGSRVLAGVKVFKKGKK